MNKNLRQMKSTMLNRISQNDLKSFCNRTMLSKTVERPYTNIENLIIFIIE